MRAVRVEYVEYIQRRICGCAALACACMYAHTDYRSLSVFDSPHVLRPTPLGIYSTQSRVVSIVRRGPMRLQATQCSPISLSVAKPSAACQGPHPVFVCMCVCVCAQAHRRPASPL